MLPGCGLHGARPPRSPIGDEDYRLRTRRVPARGGGVPRLAAEDLCDRRFFHHSGRPVAVHAGKCRAPAAVAKSVAPAGVTAVAMILEFGSRAPGFAVMRLGGARG